MSEQLDIRTLISEFRERGRADEKIRNLRLQVRGLWVGVIIALVGLVLNYSQSHSASVQAQAAVTSLQNDAPILTSECSIDTRIGKRTEPDEILALSAHRTWIGPPDSTFENHQRLSQVYSCTIKNWGQLPAFHIRLPFNVAIFAHNNTVTADAIAVLQGLAPKESGLIYAFNSDADCFVNVTPPRTATYDTPTVKATSAPLPIASKLTVTFQPYPQSSRSDGSDHSACRDPGSFAEDLANYAANAQKDMGLDSVLKVTK